MKGVRFAGAALLMALAFAGLAFAANPASAAARMEIRPATASCNRGPFEIFAFELEPSRDVLVDMVVDGVVTGQVGGRSEADGRFWSPIPMILLPCAAGGRVTANLRIDGQAVASTTFEVAPPGAPTPTGTIAPAPGAPAVGTGVGKTGDDGWMYVSAIGAAMLGFALVMAVSVRRRR